MKDTRIKNLKNVRRLILFYSLIDLPKNVNLPRFPLGGFLFL